MRGHQVVEHREDAGDQFGLAMTAIRKEGVVGGIDVTDIGPGLRRLAKDGEAAQAGIEHKDGRRGRHDGA